MTDIDTRDTNGAVAKTRWAPVVALALAMVVVTSDLTIASVALPSLGADLGVVPATAAWVLLGYALPMSAIAIPAGRWADRADIRHVFILSMTGVAVASLLAAVAPYFWVLVIARFLQGFTAALTMAVYMPTIAASVRTDQRGRAIGYVITIMTIGGLIGSPLGGLVTGTLGWRAVFLMKLPVVVAAIWLGLRAMPRNGKGLPLPDWTLLRDTLVMGAAVTAMLLTFDRLETQPFLAAILAVAAVGLSMLWLRLPTSAPLIAVVHRRVLGLPLLGLFLMSFIVGLISFLLPYFISDEMQASPQTMGIALLAFSAAMMPVAPVAGWLADRFGPHRIALLGGLVTFTGITTMFSLDSDATLFDLIWRLVAIGVGTGLFSGPINTALMAATPAEMIGTAGGLFATVRTLASTIGPAVTALAWTLAGGGLAGFKVGLATLVALSALGLIALAAGRPAKAAVIQAA